MRPYSRHGISSRLAPVPSRAASVPSLLLTASSPNVATAPVCGANCATLGDRQLQESTAVVAESQLELNLPGRAGPGTIGTAPAARATVTRAPGRHGLGFRTLAAITGVFWLYATVSAVLFNYGLGATLATITDKSLFAPWDLRVLQYALLFPPLLGCYWVSLRRGWEPLLPNAVYQLLLALAFAVLAYPAMVLADFAIMPLETQAGKDLGLDHWLAGGGLTTWLASFIDFLVRYGFGLALVTGFSIYKQYRDVESRAAAMERQWSEARLAALRMQLSPHTLFNLLHTIRGQISWDPAAAQEMVVQLADLLRRLLKAGERDFSRLADEMQFVQLYLDLQRRRFADRLTVAMPEMATLPAAWVPSLILQPLVENAIVHGLAGHAGPVHVELTIWAGGDELHLRVENTTGTERTTASPGIGLRNVGERLAVQFGERGSLVAGPQGSGRWVAEIRMPLVREQPQRSVSGHAPNQAVEA